MSTRPVGEELIAEAARHNIVIDEISFIETEATIDEATENRIVELSMEKIYAIFTSMNAVEAVRNFISSETNWKIFCIGPATKKLVAEIFGEENIAATGNTGADLADEILKQPAVKSVYFFCGNRRRDELPEKLKSNGVKVDELVIYKTLETPQGIAEHYDGVLFFSPSAVESYFSINAITEGMQPFAIGETTANAVKHFSNKPVIVAEIPNKKSLVAQAIAHFSSGQNI
ncbi:MAG: uroporphyrinogen-III synthase [Ginsengibacter sp.]